MDIGSFCACVSFRCLKNDPDALILIDHAWISYKNGGIDRSQGNSFPW